MLLRVGDRAVLAIGRGAAWALLGLALGCGSPKAPSSSAATGSAPDDGRQVCESVMRRTRECKELYVPALLRTRARYDQPPGIAARYAKDGEATLLPVAREEFERDWSDAGIASHCDALVAKEPRVRQAIVERERACLSRDDCLAFVACNMESLAKKWGAKAAQSPPPLDAGTPDALE